jgi:hypothetical protein
MPIPNLPKLRLPFGRKKLFPRRASLTTIGQILLHLLKGVKMMTELVFKDVLPGTASPTTSLRLCQTPPPPTVPQMVRMWKKLTRKQAM